jgi:hypothetical protein
MVETAGEHGCDCIELFGLEMKLEVRVIERRRCIHRGRLLPRRHRGF